MELKLCATLTLALIAFVVPALSDQIELKESHILDHKVEDSFLNGDDSVAEFGDDDSYSRKDSLLFGLWPGIVKPIDNGGETCKSAVSGEIGTCQTKQYCCNKGGTTLDFTTCKGSHTVCCKLTAAAGCPTEGPCIIKDNSILLTNVNDGIHQREYVFPKIKGACQLKLQIIKFELSQPNSEGVCEQDSLSVTGTSTVRHFTLCGNVNNEELYFTFGCSDKIGVNIDIKTATGAKYIIKPTFISCDSSERAPEHCLQYFTTMKGTVRSFNYHPNTGQHLSNLDYTVCVKELDDATHIKWSECSEPNAASSFIISGDPNKPTTPPSQTGMNCPKDWVSIHGHDRHCGTSFGGSVTSTARPFVLNVHFNPNEFVFSSIVIPGPTCQTIPPFESCALNANNVCVCQFPAGSASVSSAEILNTGFCLDYSQES